MITSKNLLGNNFIYNDFFIIFLIVLYRALCYGKIETLTSYIYNIYIYI